MEETKTKRQRQPKSLKILFPIAEALPFAKAGGLADVGGALPAALKKLGHDVRLVMPRYKFVDEDKHAIKYTGRQVTINIALFDHVAEIREAVLPETGMTVYFIENIEFYFRDEVYGHYWDNAERFMFLSRAALEMLPLLEFTPDIIHCNDWHTALIPVFLKTIYKEDERYAGIKSVLTIHNTAFQGNFHAGILSHAQLPEWLFAPEYMEFYGGISFLKGGIALADAVTAVSQAYAQETKTPQFGFGMEGALTARGEDYTGILSGVDYTAWNPAVDRMIFHNYVADTLEEKEENKKRLLEEAGLKYIENLPLVAIASRLDDQQGLDTVAVIAEEMMKINLQLIVYGTGDHRYTDMFQSLKSRYPQKIALFFKNDIVIEHKIFAGADIMMMPSRFEPSGSGQLIAMKYGAVPLARETGGLADAVKQYNFKTKQGNGFLFSGHNPWDLFQALRIVLDTYKNIPVWQKIQENGMKMNLSWETTASKYVELYNKALEK